MSELMQHKVVSLRERNKLDKLRRIKEAASELLIRKGYDDTTTREIAVRAGVGLGTIFVYAATKRDLLFLLVNDKLQEVVDKATADVRAERPILDNLLRIFQWHYRYFAQEPQLWRLALREMSFYDTGPEAQKYLRTRERFITLITEVVRMALDQKAISSPERAELIAWVIFSIFQIEVRHWLSTDELNLRRGINALRRQLVLLMNGLSPRPVI